MNFVGGEYKILLVQFSNSLEEFAADAEYSQRCRYTLGSGLDCRQLISIHVQQKGLGRRHALGSSCRRRFSKSRVCLRLLTVIF